MINNLIIEREEIKDNFKKFDIVYFISNFSTEFYSSIYRNLVQFSNQTHRPIKKQIKNFIELIINSHKPQLFFLHTSTLMDYLQTQWIGSFLYEKNIPYIIHLKDDSTDKLKKLLGNIKSNQQDKFNFVKNRAYKVLPSSFNINYYPIIDQFYITVDMVTCSNIGYLPDRLLSQKKEKINYCIVQSK